MDETRLRAVIREEIALAMKTLEDQAYSSDPEDDVSLERALSSFNSYAYQGACETADEERARNAENPFEQSEPGEAVDETVKSFVHGEAANILREVRDAFRLSGDGRASDVVDERLSHAADNYGRTADE